jgi:hypothetical protein
MNNMQIVVHQPRQPSLYFISSKVGPGSFIGLIRFLPRQEPALCL